MEAFLSQLIATSYLWYFKPKPYSLFLAFHIFPDGPHSVHQEICGHCNSTFSQEGASETRFNLIYKNPTTITTLPQMDSKYETTVVKALE